MKRKCIALYIIIYFTNAFINIWKFVVNRVVVILYISAVGFIVVRVSENKNESFASDYVQRHNYCRQKQLRDKAVRVKVG